jgi:membrane associated rhomboid family serine protease
MEHGLIATAPVAAVTTAGTNPARRRTSFFNDEQAWWLPKASFKQFFQSVTCWIMLSHVGVFIYSLLFLSGGFVSPYLNATFGPSRCALIAAGAKFSPYVIQREEYWRILSASFIHSGVITLAVSATLEYFLVLPVELEYGKIITILLFILCGATGYTFSCVATPTAISTGALAPIMGFVGFRIAYDILDWHAIAPRERRRVGALEAGAAFIVLIVGQSPFVDNYGAFAGFVIGCFVGGAYFAHRIDATVPSQRIVIAMAVMATAFVIFVCSFLLGAGNFPLIEDAVWTTLCAPPPENIYDIALAGEQQP